MPLSPAHSRQIVVALALLVVVTTALLVVLPPRPAEGPTKRGSRSAPVPDFALLQWHALRGGAPATLTPISPPDRAVRMAEQLVDQYRPAGHRVYRERPHGYEPKAIVMHATGSGEPGSGFSTARELGEFFARPSTHAAAHYGVDREGRVARYVDESHAAFHVATPGWNDVSIGIELLNDNSGRQGYPPAQLAAARRLVQAIAARHDIPLEGVVTHASVQPSDRRDPVGFPWRRWHASLAAR